MHLVGHIIPYRTIENDDDRGVPYKCVCLCVCARVYTSLFEDVAVHMKINELSVQSAFKRVFLPERTSVYVCVCFICVSVLFVCVCPLRITEHCMEIQTGI